MTVPVTSGTYNFAPSLGEMVLYAFGCCGIRRTAITQQHMLDARLAVGMMLARWSGERGVNLWAVDLQTVSLSAGTATYSVPSNTVVMLDAYITVNSGSSSINRLILPITRSEYASYPNPQQQGAVTVFWFDRLLSPTFTLWPVPDYTQTQLSYYRMRQIQDANYTDAQQPEIPQYYYEAFAYGLAARLAVIWAPEREVGLKALADEAYEVASTQNTEAGSVYISPVIQTYFSP